MRDTNPGAVVKTTLQQQAVAIQDVPYVGDAWTACSTPHVVEQPEYVRSVGLQVSVPRGNRLRGASCNLRVVDPWPRIALAGLAEQLVRLGNSTFQFKRMRHFVSSLPIAPPNLTEHLEAVVAGNEQHGIEVLEGLVRDVLGLVEQYVPEANTSALRYPPGARQRPLRVADLDG